MEYEGYLLSPQKVDQAVPREADPVDSAYGIEKHIGIGDLAPVLDEGTDALGRNRRIGLLMNMIIIIMPGYCYLDRFGKGGCEQHTQEQT